MMRLEIEVVHTNRCKGVLTGIRPYNHDDNDAPEKIVFETAYSCGALSYWEYSTNYEQYVLMGPAGKYRPKDCYQRTVKEEEHEEDSAEPEQDRDSG